MKLPGGDDAVVELAKLRDYCLNPSHARGRHKARVFQAALGLARSDAEYLRGELLRAAREADAVAGDTDEFGTRYSIDFTIERNELRAVVRSSWIVRDRDVPHLTSCYVL
jgi:hypothetical protein